ncbi:MAG TPA: 16S rRNA (guanine(966)-N(2))-methyltransferase RsmD [Acidimicrobiales bacterium]|nr:16S rRNA (guanine(966)-N(2))-methyltransferase RsmD [Acidimicrobiales bacterium]
MRVIAGSARGRRLSAPGGTATRPTADRVRQATFNALDSRGAVAGAVVLDAFAGSGALGIEALSRGAARCTFVERDRSARRVVEANLAATGVDGRARLVDGDALAHLAATAERFDLVLLDPPHATDAWPALLDLVAARLDRDAVVVVESDRPIIGDGGQLDGGWRVIREKRYGGTVVQMLVPGPGPSS